LWRPVQCCVGSSCIGLFHLRGLGVCHFGSTSSLQAVSEESRKVQPVKNQSARSKTACTSAIPPNESPSRTAHAHPYDVVAVMIFHASVRCECLKVGILSEVFAMIGAHRHNEGLHIGAASSNRRHESVELLLLATLVCVYVTIKPFLEGVALTIGNC
jgi:hypothetical protein